ncbi:hypothetical protein, partial [Nitrococcus mobilis]|uniref:hypothetical protein n=1 Tax=Nitrococcus mobilis TaxID=35797 RepID=UPI001E35D07C
MAEYLSNIRAKTAAHGTSHLRAAAPTQNPTASAPRYLYYAPITEICRTTGGVADMDYVMTNAGKLILRVTL